MKVTGGGGGVSSCDDRGKGKAMTVRRGIRTSKQHLWNMYDVRSLYRYIMYRFLALFNEF